MAVIEANDLVKEYNGQRVVDDVSFVVEEAEIFTMVVRCLDASRRYPAVAKQALAGGL